MFFISKKGNMIDIEYRHLILNGPFAYAYHKIICNKDGLPIDYEFIEVNSSFEIATGLKIDNIIGKSIKEITPEIGKMEFDWISFYGNIALNGGSETIEQYSKSLGRWYQVQVFSYSKFYFTTIFIDITGSKINELKLQKTLDRNNAFLNSNPDLMFVFDTNYKIIDYHANNSLLLHTSPNNFINKYIYEIVPNEVSEVAKEAIDYVISTGKSAKNYYDLFLNGKLVHFEARYVLCGNEEVMSIVRDITDLKNAEKRLIVNEKKYRSIFENIQDIIFQLSMEETIIDISPSVENILNFEKEDILNCNFGILFFKQDDKRLFFETIIHENKITDFEALLKSKNSTPIFCSISAHLLKDSSDKAIGIEGSIRNIHKQKNIESELILAKDKAEENTRLISAFLANMSHEIRTPMNGILGFLELLKNVNLSISEKENYIEIINKSGNRLLNTINDIIEISKIEAGYLPIYNSEIIVSELIHDHILFFNPQAKEKGLTLELKNQLVPDLIIYSDKQKLDAIITNLIRNAIKFTCQGTIEMGCSYYEETLHLSFKDTGIGIPKNKLEIIFERFMQANQSLNRSHEGYGLGLSIIKAYVKRLNGTIQLNSISGIGSTFSVSIPCKQITKTIQIPEPITKKKSLNILIAEDDQASYIFLELILKAEGHQLTRGFNGKEAVNIYIQNQHFDIILMDLKMPIMDGYEATSTIRKLNPNIPIIAQTANALNSDAENAFKAGCNDYITKPINKTELISKLTFWTK